MPAEAAPGGFAEDALVLAQFGEDIGGFRTEGGGGANEEVDEGANGDKSVHRGEPLRARKVLGPVGIAGALVDEEGHGVFIG